MSKSTKNESYGNSGEIVTVKFRTDENETLTRAFDLNTTVGSLGTYLQQTLNAGPNEIAIERDGSAVERGESLKELGATSLGIFELDLRGDGLRLPKSAYYMPAVDVITVNVKKKRLVVEIEHCSMDKPWLGGYRNRDNGKVYHHAAAQTDFKPKVYADAVQVDARSQTCADKGVDHGSRDVWTQTTDAPDGRLLSAKRYQSYQSWLQEEYVLSGVLKIQRAFRRMLARKRTRQTAAVERQKTVATEPKTVTTALESKQQHFYSLYTMIGKWWKRERQRIKEIGAENCRKAAQMNLLKKEIKFLLEMEKQRSELKYELTKHDDITFLNKTSKPKMFKNKTGKLLTIDTVGNQKARVLKKMYANIMGEQGDGNNRPGRAEVLDELYAVVACSSYKYKKNLLDVIAMERDYAEIGADWSSVRSVRSRVEQMFRHFIRQPEVNPEADSYYRPTEKRILNVYTCIRCKRNLAATDFSLESRVNRTNVCANCEWTEQVGHKRIDMAPYRRMLKTLRHDEMKLAAYDSECFMMQPTEVYRLVSVVWREKSAIGECGQLNGLRLVRWRQDEPWSPWNCVLLTRAEADVHCRLVGNPADHYDAQFVNWVTNRHMTARLQFGNLVQAVKNRTANKAKPLSKNWKAVAEHFRIKTYR
ncbi:IQ motif, EF-hand binding site [Cinara cedri]|uniref:IQ motif, EF-hand binding site n=1 Tax=Cinara cedri TaxID=506608 RepID=A0A5E4MWZ3_9HEMI|nr:IQ motif, EF-hand binding site [Cinara cedri]